ncbi:hypothetical protein [Leptospira idonii]|uniref:Lipoprotein n=1 Tax=Leptospira idonii TaxID=1193500 RepID=A0A4R9LW25_9LEPT|nr:hypothetical protein [Leptospira idonii]TGN17107.1 hypothetical protein EHS15_18195 [Leptospira idonii]
MKTNQTFSIVSYNIVIFNFLFACATHPIYSEDLTPADLYYYDGKNRIELEVEPGLLAEFGAPEEHTSPKSKSGVRALDKNAGLVRIKGRTNIWKTNAQGGSVSTSKSLNQSKRIGYSPVFRSSQDGTLLALPGNIIVEFSPSLSHSHIENWLAMKGLRPVKKLEIANRNFYEVETPAGVPALNLANSLVGQEGVVSSSPNWWREVSPK